MSIFSKNSNWEVISLSDTLLKPRGKFFEELEVGDEFTTSARTITETDIVMYAGLTGDYNPVHTDEEFCKEHNIYKQRIGHGLLGLAYLDGLIFCLGLFDGTGLATLNWNWDFKRPIFIGDTIHAVTTITMKRETSKPERGIINEHVKLINQRGEVIGEGNYLNMIRRKLQD